MMPAVSLSATAARARDLLARSLYALVAQALYWTALLWRRAPVGTTFVAVTGTHGSPTT